MSTADNFDALWTGLKEQVREARKLRGDRPTIETDNGGRWGGHVSVWGGDEDGATLYATNPTGMIKVNCQAADLRAIAAQCLAAAEEVERALEEAQAVRPNTTAK